MVNSIANNIKLMALVSVMIAGTATADAAELRNKRSKGANAKVQVSVPQEGLSAGPLKGVGTAPTGAVKLRNKRSKGASAKVQISIPQEGLWDVPLGDAGAGVADLIIQPWYAGGDLGAQNTGYCGPYNSGNQSVYFYVKNIGRGIAAPSDVHVSFLKGGYNSTIAVPQLQPNQRTLRGTIIPAGARGSTTAAQFLIAADHNDDTTETNDTNNYGEGFCRFPEP